VGQRGVVAAKSFDGLEWRFGASHRIDAILYRAAVSRT
jgi:hypothetical protein